MQWYILIGVLLISVSVLEPMLKNRWLASVHIQLLGGMIASPWLLGLIDVDVVSHAWVLETASEVAVIISLYATGIKMRIPLHSDRWQASVALATLTMVLTITLVTLVAYYLLALPFPLSLLLGAVLAPTDPVLADNVQVHHAGDDDRLRQSLTGEAGLNDGTAFPFVLLAIGLANPAAHELGYGLWRWVLIDLVWKVAGGLLLGAVAGFAFGRCMSRFRDATNAEAKNQELLTLGVIAITYGAALAIDTYAFLAVFAAAVTLRSIEKNSARGTFDSGKDQTGTDKQLVELIKEQTEVGAALEQIAKVFLVFLIGVLIYHLNGSDWRIWVFSALMVLVIRPISVWSTLRVGSVSHLQRSLIAWFGIRGIGTLYYLAHAIETPIVELPSSHIKLVADCCVATILISIMFHGTTDTPLLKWYHHRASRDNGYSH